MKKINEFSDFTTSLMGSLPRSKQIMQAQRKYRNNQISKEELDKVIEPDFIEVIKMQEEFKIDIITSGELARDNYCSFVADKISGVKLMSMSEMLDYIEDKKAFEEMLEILDVSASSIRNAICINKLEYTESLTLDELLFMKKHTSKPIKITLPGPYLLTRSMWLAGLSDNYYNSKEELGEDVVAILKKEIDILQENGVAVIQFDEPVLTEVVFTEGKPRSFMCAALSEKKDPKDELAFATNLIKEVIQYVDDNISVAALHVCRGNWSKDEKTLLTGAYTPLIGVFEEVNAPLLLLEYSTPRAGELSSLFESKLLRDNSYLGLGVINPRIDTVEDISKMQERVEECLKFIPSKRIWLNPDCGFATFANQPVNVMDIIKQKIKKLTDLSRLMRDKYE